MLKIPIFLLAWLLAVFANANGYPKDNKVLSFPLHFDSITENPNWIIDIGQFYYGHIDVGKNTIQKNFRVIFDTGSSTTWILGENCEKCLSQETHKQLRQCEGNSCANYKDGQLKSISYGTGNVIGFEAVDYLSVSESALSAATKIPLSILLLVEADNYLLRQNFEGIIGLSFNSDESIGFLRQLVNSNIISNEQFSIDLSPDNPRIIFGGIESNLFQSNATMQYYPIDKDQPFWKIPIRSFSLDSKHSLLSEKKLNQQNIDDIIKESISDSSQTQSLEIIDDEEDDQMMAHIDSGSNVLMVDVETAERFRDTMKDQYNTSCAIFSEKGMNRLKCQCKNKKVSDFPTLSFKFGVSDEEEYLIEPKNYIILGEGVSTMCDTLLYVSEDETSKNEVLIGIPFFQTHYINFNAETRSIGIISNTKMISTGPQNQQQLWVYLLIALMAALISYFVASQIIAKIQQS